VPLGGEGVGRHDDAAVGDLVLRGPDDPGLGPEVTAGAEFAPDPGEEVRAVGDEDRLAEAVCRAAAACSTRISKLDPPVIVPSVYEGDRPRYSTMTSMSSGSASDRLPPAQQ